MNCPKCNTAASTHVERTGVFGPSVMRTRRCSACAVEWQTEETRRGDYTPLPAATGAQGYPPVATPARRVSSSDLDLFSASPDQYQKSSGDRESNEPTARALAVTKPAPVVRAPKSGLYEQVSGQFQAAYFAERGCDYLLTAADKSQVGRFLNPGRGNPPPPPELLADLPAVFAAFAQETREFERRQGLAWLLTKGLNTYRELARGRVRSAVSQKSRAQMENLMAIAQRGANRDEAK